MAFLLAAAVGIHGRAGCGGVEGPRRGSRDHVRCAVLAMSELPPFVVESLLIFLFGVQFPILPVCGAGSGGRRPVPAPRAARRSRSRWASVRSSCGRPRLGARRARSGLHDVRQARGLSRAAAGDHHRARNVALPVVASLGLLLHHRAARRDPCRRPSSRSPDSPAIVDAVSTKDVPALVQGLSLLVSAVDVILVSVLVDVVSSALDPRLRTRRTRWELTETVRTAFIRSGGCAARFRSRWPSPWRHLGGLPVPPAIFGPSWQSRSTRTCRISCWARACAAWCAHGLGTDQLAVTSSEAHRRHRHTRPHFRSRSPRCWSEPPWVCSPRLLAAAPTNRLARRRSDRSLPRSARSRSSSSAMLQGGLLLTVAVSRAVPLHPAHDPPDPQRDLAQVRLPYTAAALARWACRMPRIILPPCACPTCRATIITTAMLDFADRGALVFAASPSSGSGVEPSAASRGDAGQSGQTLITVRPSGHRGCRRSVVASGRQHHGDRALGFAGTFSATESGAAERPTPTSSGVEMRRY